MSTKRWIAFSLFAMATAALASSDGWIENDLEAAQQRAREQGKDVLVNFSGSDWCGWCIRLDEEVFSKTGFVEEASRSFVLAVLDFPRQPENVQRIPEAQRASNARWQETFGIEGFPTVLLLDAEGRVFARTGYRPGGPEPYLAHLTALREQRTRRENALAEAAAPGLSPADRARLLDQALGGSDPAFLLSAHRTEVEQILAADPDNALGFRTKYLPMIRMRDIETAVRSGRVDEGITLLDGLIGEIGATGETLQQLLGARFSLLMMTQRPDEAREALRRAIEAAPQGAVADAMRQHYEQVFSAE